VADLLVLLGSLALYLTTVARDILPADNGEFQLVAAVLGVAHPPGYPLHTMLGWLMAQLPIGTIPWRVNLLSVILAAGTLTLVSASVRRLTGRPGAGLAAAMALGTSTTFWAQATVSNVRTPAAFFTALCLYALIRHREAKSSGRYLTLFAASLTLGLTHHLSLAFVALFLVAYLFFIDPSLLRQPRRWRAPALAVLLCLLPLIYLPLRADGALAPANLGTLSGFLQHALALGFSGDFFYFTAPADLFARLRVMGNVLAFQFHPLVLIGAAAGALVLLRRDRRLATLLLGGFILHTMVTATYRAPQTVEYMLPAYVLLAITLGCGLGLASKRQDDPSTETGVAGTASGLLAPALAVLFIVVGLVQGIQRFPSYRALAHSDDTRSYTTAILEGAPQGAVVLADWHWVMPLRYLQMVEGVRPDLSIQYVYPTGEPYEGTWARRIQEELPERPVIVTHYHELAYTGIEAIFEPLGEAYWVRSEPRSELPAGFTPLDTSFGDRLRVIGSVFPVAEIPADETLIFTLAWSPAANSSSPITLFAHLVGYDGALYAQQDTVLDTRFVGPDDVALTQFRLTPRPGALPGAYSLQIGAYTEEGILVESSGQERVELRSVELSPARTGLYTGRPRRQAFGDGPILAGLDWDLTLPDQPRLYLHWRAGQETAPMAFTLLTGETPLAEIELPALPAGSHQVTVHALPSLPRGLALVATLANRSQKRVSLPLPLTSEQYLPFGSGIIYLGATPTHGDSPPGNLYLHFAASYPIQRDYVVSASLIGLNPDRTWAWQDLDDGVPAMGAIPTLKWIAGSRVTDPHRLAVPPDAPPGPVIGTLILYDAFTGRPLPLLDERLAAAAPWAPLGEWTVGP
jgi:4-amino-4-deoxy-L-arabinose transferase-like glycosyltransferase